MKLFTDDKAFLNLTNIYVPDDVKWLFSLGKKFAIAKHVDFPLFDIIADTEEIVKTITNTTCRDIVRARIANAISNTQSSYAQKTSSTDIQRIITHIYERCTNFCKENKDIIVVPSDKTNCTVIMYTDQYDNKLKDLLNDSNTYEIIASGDPTNVLQNTNNKYIIDLFNRKIIDKKTKNMLTNYNANPPKMYALPKTHKVNIPMRPVIASINTPISGLSKFLANILKQLLVGDSFNVTNSFVFKNRISPLALDKNDRLVSFDIVSLFTNIPVNLAIEIIAEKWEFLERHTNIPRDSFFKLLKFCLVDANYFSIKSVFYRQIYGMPMGNPMSSVIADIVTQRLLNTTLDKLIIKPKLLVKYVDDIFAILPENIITTTLDALNSFHDKLKFTVEIENNKSIPFLDVLVTRNDNGSISTNWYHKDMASNRILNYFSNHPMCQKRNTAYNFANRVLSLSSSCYRKKNINKIYTILKMNNYPINTIKGAVSKALQKLIPSTQTQDISPNTQPTQLKTYRSLTYIEGLSEKITKIAQTYNNNVSIAHTSNVCLNNVFTKLKDKTPFGKKTGVIYQIPCLGDKGEQCSLTYVGQTKQFLEKRLKNHKYDIKKPDVEGIPKTAVVQHFQQCGHYPDFEKTKILSTQKQLSKRITMEALHIYTQNTYNLRRDVDEISPIFCALLDDAKNNKRKRNDDVTSTYSNKRRRVV